LAFEKAEEADAIAMVVVVAAIVDRCHACDWTTISLGNEQGAICIPIERIAFPIEVALDHHAKGGHPFRRGPSLDAPREIDEPGHTAPTIDLFDRTRHCEALPNLRTVVK
jgi:hypothetical protein